MLRLRVPKDALAGWRTARGQGGSRGPRRWLCGDAGDRRGGSRGVRSGRRWADCRLGQAGLQVRLAQVREAGRRRRPRLALPRDGKEAPSQVASSRGDRGDGPGAVSQPGSVDGVQSRSADGPSPSPEPHQEAAVPVQIRGPRDAHELGPRAQSGAGARAGGRGADRRQGLRGGESPRAAGRSPPPGDAWLPRVSPQLQAAGRQHWAQGHMGTRGGLSRASRAGAGDPVRSVALIPEHQSPNVSILHALSRLIVTAAERETLCLPSHFSDEGPRCREAE